MKWFQRISKIGWIRGNTILLDMVDEPTAFAIVCGECPQSVRNMPSNLAVEFQVAEALHHPLGRLLRGTCFLLNCFKLKPPLNSSQVEEQVDANDESNVIQKFAALAPGRNDVYARWWTVSATKSRS